MTHLAGVIKARRDRDRLYLPLATVLLVNSCVAVAAEAIALGRFAPFEPAHTLDAESVLFPVNVRLPLFGHIHSAVTGQPLDEIEIAVEPRPQQSHVFRHQTRGFKAILLQVVTPVFVNFFEAWRPWIDSALGNDPQSWPTVLSFARVIRNSISHRGTIHFRNPSSPRVQWHHISYGPSDQGRLIVGGDFSLADFLILMIETSEELDRLGCPAM